MRAEFHLHTKASIDSRMDADTVIRACLKNGITCLFVTDHNEIWMAKKLQELAPFRVIAGEEITTEEGEMIGYFLTKKIAPYQSPEATIGEIRRQGGLVSIPHPFDRLRRARMRYATLQRIVADVDILEIFNARNVLPRDDAQAHEYAKTNQKFMVVASDAHSRWEVGGSYVELPDFQTPNELLHSLQQASFRCRRSWVAVHAITTFNKFRSRAAGRLA
ncbi:MAG: PHP domain-containing protein [Candidatus Kerfeldbacteria bacterium]|nr:PHP domain-containing protein [Candidatus Kerfeldbacteria bacterium]